MFDDVVGEIVFVVADGDLDELVEVERLQLETVEQCRQLLVQREGEQNDLQAEHDQRLVDDVLVDEKVEATVRLQFRLDDALQQAVVERLGVLEAVLSIGHHLLAERRFHLLQPAAQRVEDALRAGGEDDVLEGLGRAALAGEQRLQFLYVLLAAGDRRQLVAGLVQQVLTTQRRLRHQARRHLTAEAILRCAGRSDRQ